MVLVLLVNPDPEDLLVHLVHPESQVALGRADQVEHLAPEDLLVQMVNLVHPAMVAYQDH